MIVVSPIAAEASFVRVPLCECGPKAVELEHKETFKLFPSVPASLGSQAAYVSYLVSNASFRIIIIKVLCCILNQDSSTS